MKMFIFLSVVMMAYGCDAHIDQGKDVRNISGFKSLRVSDGINVYLTQGDDFYVRVEADDDELDRIVTEVEGQTLNIYYKGRSWLNFNMGHSNVYITMPVVESITSSGGSDVYGQNTIKASDLELHSSGGSDINIDVEANELTIHSSGGADVRAEGHADYLEAHSSGGSDILGYDLEVKVAILDSSGGSDIKITVNDEITANASGGSDIYYRGNPEKVNVNSSGGGDVHKR